MDNELTEQEVSEAMRDAAVLGWSYKPYSSKLAANLNALLRSKQQAETPLMRADQDGNFVELSKKLAVQICEKLEIKAKWPDSAFMYIADVIGSGCFQARDAERKRHLPNQPPAAPPSLLAKLRELREAAHGIRKSIGHISGCKFGGCTCGAGERQREALDIWKIADRELDAIIKEAVSESENGQEH